MNLSFESVTYTYPYDILADIWRDSLGAIEPTRARWSYELNPQGRAHVWLMRDQATGEYVGCSALLPRRVLINGTELLAGVLVDTGVKAAYRTLGPALALHRNILERSGAHEILFAFPTPVVEPVLLRVGFKRLCTLSTMTKILSMNFVIRKCIGRRLPLPSMWRWRASSQLAVFPHGGLDNEAQRNVSQSAERFDCSFDHIARDFRAHAHMLGTRDAEYLNWRYIDCPLKSYRLFVWKDSPVSRPTGYVIYYLDNNRSYVVDFLWPGDTVQLKRLLAGFAQAMRTVRVEAISISFNGNPVYHRTLAKTGFVPRPENIPVVYYAKNRQLQNILATGANSLFVTVGDRDV